MSLQAIQKTPNASSRSPNAAHSVQTPQSSGSQRQGLSHQSHTAASIPNQASHLHGNVSPPDYSALHTQPPKEPSISVVQASAHGQILPGHLPGRRSPEVSSLAEGNSLHAADQQACSSQEDGAGSRQDLTGAPVTHPHAAAHPMFPRPGHTVRGNSTDTGSLSQAAASGTTLSAYVHQQAGVMPLNAGSHLSPPPGLQRLDQPLQHQASTDPARSTDTHKAGLSSGVQPNSVAYPVSQSRPQSSMSRAPANLPIDHHQAKLSAEGSIPEACENAQALSSDQQPVGMALDQMKAEAAGSAAAASSPTTSPAASWAAAAHQAQDAMARPEPWPEASQESSQECQGHASVAGKKNAFAMLLSSSRKKAASAPKPAGPG